MEVINNMKAPKFDTEELKVVGECPTFTPGIALPIYDYPVSLREANEALFKREPYWQMTCRDQAMFSPMVNPDNIARGFIFEARQLDGEVGVGQLYLEGNVTEHGDIQCSMGSVEMYLEMGEEDYNYAVECGMGSVEIGGRAYSGLAREQYVDNGAARQIDVDCAMGSVEIYFD